MLRNRLKTNSLLWILKRSKRSLPAIGVMVLLSMVSSWFGIQFALSTQRVIDAAVSGDSAALTRAGLLLGGLITVTIGTGLFSRHWSDKLDVRMDWDMKQQMMHCILRGDYQALSRYHSGDLVHRLNTDISVVNGGLVGIATMIFSLAVSMAGAMAVMAQVSLPFTLILLAVCAVIGGATLAMQQMLKNILKRINDSSGRISGFLQEVIEKLLIVQALDMGTRIEEKTDDLLEKRWQLQRKKKNLDLLSSAGLTILGQGLGFITLLWCAGQLRKGLITFGTLTAITQLASRLEAPIFALPALLRELISMSASAERLMEIEAVPQEDKDQDIDLKALYEDMESLKAEDLSFAYNRDKVLDGLSFEIPKGSLTVIVGQSGSGKSTLLRLLLSIYKPGEGSISIRKKDGTQIPNSRDVRKLFTYAPQGNLLMSGTLRDNLVFACPDATEAEIQEAVHISAIDDYLPMLPQGLDTYIGENGTGLSEGQAQRVALARAILSRAPILLLDEVTSALDMDTEEKVLQRIRSLKDRTCIVVTHRPAVLKLADVTLNIVDGRMYR